MGRAKRRRSGLSRRTLLKGAGATALLGGLPAAVRGAAPATPPNILFILADDLGYADLSSYGRREYRTPSLDRLAAQGLLMTSGYANSAVCSATRVALITGRYQYRIAAGLEEPLTGREKIIGLPPEHPTLPSLLKDAGYRTSLVGKWHMGAPPAFGPLQSGYERFFGIVSGAADYFTHRTSLVNDGESGLYDGAGKVERRGYMTDLLADRAVDEIREAARAKRPFLVSLHFTAPHWPWQGPGDEAAAGKVRHLMHFDGGTLEKYAEMVVAMDAAIGRVLAELDAQGLARDTIVVFTSDNGGERFSDNWPFTGGKTELLEGGIRVPLIVRWPRAISAGSRTPQVMTSMDWLPTLLAAAGAASDRRFPPDGMNLLPVLTGHSEARPRTLYWRYKKSEQAAVRDGDWKYLRLGGHEYLFDVAKDPRERANLKELHAERFSSLKQQFAAWNEGMLPYPADSVSGNQKGDLADRY